MASNMEKMQKHIHQLKLAIEARNPKLLQGELARAKQFESSGVAKSVDERIQEEWAELRQQAAKVSYELEQEGEELELAIEESLRTYSIAEGVESKTVGKPKREGVEFDGTVEVIPDRPSTLRLGGLTIEVPAGCVTKPTELYAERIPAKSARRWEWPFVLKFADGQQPLKGVEIFMRTTDTEDLRKLHIQLMHMPDMTTKGEYVMDQAYFCWAPGQRANEISSIAVHFSMFRFRVGPGICTFDGVEIDENATYHRSYDNFEECNSTGYTRGELPYYLAYGFQRKGLSVPDFETMWAHEPAGYHGTTIDGALGILRQRFQLPSERGGVRPNHIALSRRVFSVDNWGDAVFLSPSHKYCMAPHYGGAGTLRTLLSRADAIFACTGSIPDDMMVFCLLQCRIQKEGLTRNPSTGGHVFPGTSGCELNECDLRVPSTGMEYRVANPRSVKPYGLLFRFVPEAEVRETMFNRDML